MATYDTNPPLHMRTPAAQRAAIVQLLRYGKGRLGRQLSTWAPPGGLRVWGDRGSRPMTPAELPENRPEPWADLASELRDLAALCTQLAEYGDTKAADLRRRGGVL